MNSRSLVLVIAALSWGSGPGLAVQALPHDVPDLCASVPNRVVIAAGQTETWTGSRQASCIELRGKLVIAGDLTVTTILGYPGSELEKTTPGEIVFRDAPIDTAADPEQFGHGLVSFGTVTLRGAARTGGPVRLAAEPLAGQTTLSLATPVNGWRAGDALILPGTRQLTSTDIYGAYQPQWEELTVASVSGDGRTITLTRPLEFDHRGARNLDGALLFLPHVGNLSRSIVIRSENPSGTRGHLLFTHHAHVDIQYVEIRDMGRTRIDPLNCTLRAVGAAESATHCTAGSGPIVKIGTNQIGRYPVHFHHLIAPPVFNGNSVRRSRKWPVAIHNTHYGTFTENVLYQGDGALLMTEDGNETANVIARNFAVRAYGTGGREGFGREGTGFYLRGILNRVSENVAANVLSDGPDSGYGFKIFNIYAERTRRARFAGADVTNSAEVDVVDANRLALVEFRDNEAYGEMESGLTAWWLGYGVYYVYPEAGAPVPVAARSVIQGFTAWHTHNKCVFAYESSQVTYDRLTCIGKQTDLANYGWIGGDYIQEGTIVRNAHIEGMFVGIDTSTLNARHEQRIENSVFRNRYNIVLNSLFTSGNNGLSLKPRDVIVINTRFAAVPGQPLMVVHYNYSTEPTRHLVQHDRTTFFSLNGVAGDDVEYFAREQAPDFIVPATRNLANQVDPNGFSVVGAPVAGLTNAQTWAAYRIAIRGAVAPCANTRTGFLGFVCSTDGTPPPPGPPGPPTPPPPGPPGEEPSAPVTVIVQRAAPACMILVMAPVTPDQTPGWVARFQLYAGASWADLGLDDQAPYARLLQFPPGTHLVRTLWTKEGVALPSAAGVVTCR